MKKIILIMSVFAFGFTNAQEMKLGVKAGGGFTTIVGGELSGGSQFGYHVGALAEFTLSEKFALQPELLFSKKGASFTFFGIDQKTNLTYVDIPIMAKFYVMEGLSIEAGPQIGFLMSAKSKYDGETIDIKDDLKSLDYGLNIGAGYKLDNGLMFQARYCIGLADISKDVDTTEGDPNYNEKNAGFQISVGFQF